MVLIQFILILLVLIISLFALSLSLAFFFGPPYLPTPKKVINEAFDLIKLGKNDLLSDLGSGDGAVLVEAAKRGAMVKGWEINPFLVVASLLKIRKMGFQKKATVHIGLYTKADLKKTTVVFLYILPSSMEKIVVKLKKELNKNAKIISYKFPIPNLQLIKKTKSDLYIYKLK